MILDAEKIRALRVEWLDDFVDLRPEWSQAVAASASAGATSLSLSGLASSGTLRAGAAFELAFNGAVTRYVTTADAAISSGAATVKIAPALAAAIGSATPVRPEPRKKSLYNKRTGRLFFSDEDLEAYADRAMSIKGRAIRSSDDPDRALFRAVRFYAWEAMLSADEYLSAVLADDGRGNAAKILEQKRALHVEDESIVFDAEMGPQTLRLER